MTPGRPSKSRSTRKEGELPDPQTMGYEEAIAEWEAIIDRIESGEVGLEESLVLYQRGMALQARCRSILDKVEQSFNELTPPKSRSSSSDSDDEDADDTPEDDDR